MAEVNDNNPENTKNKQDSKPIFENSVRKYPVFDEEKFASIKYENESDFDDTADKEEETPAKKIDIRSTPIPQKFNSGQPKPYYETKPSLIPTSSKKETNVKKPELVTTPLGNPNYRYAGKETFLQYIRNHMPKEFFPTARIAPIIGVIFVAVILINLGLFAVNQMGSMFSANPDPSAMTIKVGLPMSFMVFDTENPSRIPLKFGGLIVDIIVFILLAYAIDVFLNYAHSQTKSLSLEERKKHPKIYKIKQENTLAEKITKKLFDDY